MNREIQAVAVDLDGTWLDSRGGISKRTYQTVQRAIDCGYIIVPTTGRNYRNSSEVLKNYRGLRYFVNANGTAVIDAAKDRLLCRHTMPYRMAKEIYDLTEDYECYIEIYQGKDAHIDAFGRDFLYDSGLPRDYCDNLMYKNRVEDSLDAFMDDPAREIGKYHILCRTVDEKNELLHRIAQVPDAYPISTMEKNIEVVKGHWSKADGLKKTAELLGIPKERWMAVGDSDNDLGMLQWAGFAAAMGNANKNVKSVSDYLSKSNDDDGLAAALEECLKL